MPATAMITSRGCPYHCIFCYRSKERSKTRFRSPSNIVDEMEEVVKSGNQKILDRVKKETRHEQYRVAFKLLTNLGLETRGSFMIGLPHEAPKTIRDTINFAKSLDLSKAFFNVVTPYPGSVLYDKAIIGDGIYLRTYDWKEYQRWGNAVIELEDVSSQELIKWQKRAMLEFYLRPQIIWHHLKYFVGVGHDPLYYKPQPFKWISSVFNIRGNM